MNSPDAQVFRKENYKMSSIGFQCSSKEQLKLSIVQYFEELDNGKVRMDKIDTYLQCIQLCWHRTAVEVGRLSSVRESGKVPKNSIGGRLQAPVETE